MLEIIFHCFLNSFEPLGKPQVLFMKKKIHVKKMFLSNLWNKFTSRSYFFKEIQYFEYFDMVSLINFFIFIRDKFLISELRKVFSKLLYHYLELSYMCNHRNSHYTQKLLTDTLILPKTS